MKRTNEQSLKQALEGLVQDYGLGAKLDEQELRALWPEAVGEMINRHTKTLTLRKGTLTVTVDNAPLRQELTYRRNELKALMNERIQREVVMELKVQ